MRLIKWLLICSRHTQSFWSSRHETLRAVPIPIMSHLLICWKVSTTNTSIGDLYIIGGENVRLAPILLFWLASASEEKDRHMECVVWWCGDIGVWLRYKALLGISALLRCIVAFFTALLMTVTEWLDRLSPVLKVPGSRHSLYTGFKKTSVHPAAVLVNIVKYLKSKNV